MKRNSVFCIEYWLNKGYNKEQAQYQISIRRPTSINYFVHKFGVSLKEAERLKSEHQSNASKQHKNKAQNRPNSLEYWTTRGYDEDQARIEISKRQARGKEFFINKYGKTEGIKRWKQRQINWQNTLKSKPKKEINFINNKKKSLNYKKLKTKFKTDNEIKEHLKQTRNMNLVLTVDEFKQVIIESLNNNPDWHYGSAEQLVKKFARIQFDILKIKNPKVFLEPFVSKLKDVVFQTSGKYHAYRKWVGTRLLRSSSEIKFFEMLNNKKIEYVIDECYPNSNFRCDFYLPKYNYFIEIAPMYHNNKKYQEKMNYKKKVFDCIILTNISEMKKFLEEIDVR